MTEANMTDRELLKAAAKAAGLTIEYWAQNDYPVVRDGDAKFGWNPLTYDSDALRLAVRLRITPHIDGNMTEAEAETEGWFFSEPHIDDPYAATRRAIVRAAAAMPARLVLGAA